MIPLKDSINTIWLLNLKTVFLLLVLLTFYPSVWMVTFYITLTSFKLLTRREPESYPHGQSLLHWWGRHSLRVSVPRSRKTLKFSHSSSTFISITGLKYVLIYIAQIKQKFSYVSKTKTTRANLWSQNGTNNRNKQVCNFPTKIITELQTTDRSILK